MDGVVVTLERRKLVEVATRCLYDSIARSTRFSQNGEIADKVKGANGSLIGCDAIVIYLAGTHRNLTAQDWTTNSVVVAEIFSLLYWSSLLLPPFSCALRRILQWLQILIDETLLLRRALWIVWDYPHSNIGSNECSVPECLIGLSQLLIPITYSKPKQKQS